MYKTEHIAVADGNGHGLTTPQMPNGSLAVEIRFVWRERRRVLVPAIIASVLSLVLALLWPPTYESSARLIPSEPSTLSSLSLTKLNAIAGVALGSAGIESMGLRTPAARFVAVLKSRTLANRLVDRFGLMKLYGARTKELAVEALAQRTDVVEDRKSGIISLAVRDRDPKRAAQIAAGYIEELDRLNDQLNTGAAHQERLFLGARLAEAQKDLTESSKRLAEFSSKNVVVAVEQQAKAMTEGIGELQGQLIAAEANLHGLREVYTDNNVKVKQAQAQVSELRRQLLAIRGPEDDSQAGTGIKVNTGDYIFPSMRSLPRLGVTYAEILRANKVQAAVFEVLSQEFERAKLEEVKELPTVKVLDQPNVPELRISPKRKLIVLAGALVGILGGIAWIFLRRKWLATNNADPYKELIRDAYSACAESRLMMSIHLGKASHDA